MNERYQGDGPGGQTRKSAARAKPVSQAASSVHIPKKPQTAAEKRTARKAREKEAEAKAAERARKQAERAKEAGTTQSAPPPARKGFFEKLIAPPPNMPSSEEYRKWRRVYWVLLGIGIFTVVIAFIAQSASPENWMIFLTIAYIPIIAAFVVDFRKVRPLIKAHQAQGGASKSPKQLKHEREAKERAEAIEAARKAARDAKRPPRRKKKAAETIVPGQEQATDATGTTDTILPGDDN
jgi:hypothetical protein